MNRKMRLVGIMALLFFVTGCSGYRTMGTFGDGIGSGPGLDDLRPGDQVRVILISGPKVEGKVVEIGPESLTIMVTSPYVWSEKESGEGEIGKFPYRDLQAVEIREESNSGVIIMAVVLLGVATVAVIGASVNNSLSELDDWVSSSNYDGPILSRNQRLAQ